MVTLSCETVVIMSVYTCLLMHLCFGVGATTGPVRVDDTNAAISLLSPCDPPVPRTFGHAKARDLLGHFAACQARPRGCD
jgi:hypothetical protein